MQLLYLDSDGVQRSIPLGDRPLSVGRRAEADIMLLDEQASRVHCDIRRGEGAHYLHDLKSKNGTFVNDVRVERHALSPGERIRVGGSVFLVVNDQAATEAADALRELQEELDRGQGAGAVLREIVDQTESARPGGVLVEPLTGEGPVPDVGRDPPPQAEEPASPRAADAPPSTGGKRPPITGKKKIVAKKKIQGTKPPLKVRVRKPRREQG